VVASARGARRAPAVLAPVFVLENRDPVSSRPPVPVVIMPQESALLTTLVDGRIDGLLLRRRG
jgi:hypothetical protein